MDLGPRILRTENVLPYVVGRLVFTCAKLALYKLQMVYFVHHEKVVSIFILVCFLITGQAGQYHVFAQVDPIAFYA